MSILYCTLCFTEFVQDPTS